MQSQKSNPSAETWCTESWDDAAAVPGAAETETHAQLQDFNFKSWDLASWKDNDRATERIIEPSWCTEAEAAALAKRLHQEQDTDQKDPCQDGRERTAVDVQAGSTVRLIL